MLGDKIVVKKHHTDAAAGVYEKIKQKVTGGSRTAITVAGESGSGKSEIAHEIGRIFYEKNGFRSVTLHQDDYFIRPPRSNDEARRQDIGNVGMHEVRLGLLDEHIKEAKKKDSVTLKKPLIDYDNNAVLEEELDLAGISIILAEGTYTTALKNADIKVFIDRTFMDTLEHRKERARDRLDEYTERILKIEHEVISLQKNEADIIISKDYTV
ncbi:MAG: hypothetical protein JXJ19_07640 [Elusimicrobia bacterium]|nr:hypothetical protein [Elusimicrobiota bacterium]